ncbi:MAG: YsnF/AvaK domain-containing protein, partial [Nitrososphaeraceae archaeon]|nr:YsnF/AvaK domain-containing protein [Nitrososphaeraceae archaeon]
MESDSNNNNANTNTEINWNTIIKHDTRSIDDADLGKVQGLFEPFVVTERGTINKEKFYIPKNLVERYNNGEVLYFNITEQEAKDICMKNTPPSEDDAKHIVQTITGRRSGASKKEPTPTMLSSTQESKVTEADNDETRVQVIEDRLDVSKKESMEEATVIKEPIKETKTVEVQLTHDELIIERRPASKIMSTTSSTSTSEPSPPPTSPEEPVQTKTEINIPLMREEIIVSKKPYVKEEIVIKKKPVTETKT